MVFLRTEECIGAWDTYKIFYPRVNTNQLALMILNKFPEEKQKELLESIGIELDLTQDIQFMDGLKEFKKGNITMKELKKYIAKTFVDS